MTKLTREQRFEIKRAELIKLKAELAKANGPYKRQTLIDEIRVVARQLVALQEP